MAETLEKSTIPLISRLSAIFVKKLEMGLEPKEKALKTLILRHFSLVRVAFVLHFPQNGDYF